MAAVFPVVQAILVLIKEHQNVVLAFQVITLPQKVLKNVLLVFLGLMQILVVLFHGI